MNTSLESLRELARQINNVELQKLVLDIIDNPVLAFTDIKPLIKIEESPAAPRKHHFYTGGLIIHTYSVTLLALKIADVFEEVYGLKVDRDLVIATAILHDIFKYYQYTIDPVGGGYKAREDWYLSHDYSIIAELAKRNAPDKLIRAISEVHGQVPFSTIEGFIVHLADSIDARIGEFTQNILLNRVKELEKTCSVFKAVDYAVKTIGLKQVISAAISSSQEYKSLIDKLCQELESKPTTN